MPSKGVRVQVTVRLPVETHRRAAVTAKRRGCSLNDVIVAALGGADDPPMGPQGIKVYDDRGEHVGFV